ncbi:MAG: molybdopterin converting factor subunit 1 [Hyphomicrobiales bacterium]
MGVKLMYFAWVREKTGIGEERVQLPDGVETVADLIRWLKGRGPEFAEAFDKSDVIRAAIDQTHVRHDARLKGASEIAFFPPVTGG